MSRSRACGTPRLGSRPGVRHDHQRSRSSQPCSRGQAPQTVQVPVQAVCVSQGCLPGQATWQTSSVNAQASTTCCFAECGTIACGCLGVHGSVVDNMLPRLPARGGWTGAPWVRCCRLPSGGPSAPGGRFGGSDASVCRFLQRFKFGARSGLRAARSDLRPELWRAARGKWL